MTRIRLVFTGITLFFLIGAGAAWILSTQSIISNAWATSLGATFSILGVVVAFFQWVLPLPSSDAKTPAVAGKSSYIQEIFRQQISDQLAAGHGALIVYEKRGNVGKNIHADINQANIVERTIDGHPLVAAVFRNLEPGNYHVRQEHYPAYDLRNKSKTITVPSGDAAEVDWRENRTNQEIETKQKRLRFDLRLNSFFIGLGGIGFIVQQYLSTPYPLDIIGRILIGLGIVNLLASFVLDWFSWRAGMYLRISIFLFELAGGVFLAHRYTTLPYLNQIEIILIGLGAAYLFSTLLLGWGKWFQVGGGVAVFILELVVTLIIVFWKFISPYLPLVGLILLGLLGVSLVVNLIVYIVERRQ